MKSIAMGLLIAALAGTALAEEAPNYVVAAINNPNRKPSMTALDAARKPKELLSFAGIKPGDKVVDIFPGSYWDLLFLNIVGPNGHLFMYQPVQYYNTLKPKPVPVAFGSPPNHPNGTYYASSMGAFSFPEPVDVVWIRQNYHDLYDKFMGPADVAKFDQTVFRGLKSGGVFIVVDHTAKAGSGIETTETLHRIDGERVKQDLQKVGFQFVGETNTLRNPADPKDKVVWDASIRGKTDQFVYLFRKP